MTSTKKSILVKIMVMAMAMAVVLSIACVNASSGEQDFVNALEVGLTQDALWGSVTPFANLMIALVVFSFGYYIFKKVYKGFGKGKPRA